MKRQTVIIIVIVAIALIIVYIKIVKPALANVSTIATTSSKANSVLNIFGL
jgi:hypothetical protein